MVAMTTAEITILISVLFGTISVLIVIITAWINARIKIASLEVKIAQVEKDISNHKDDYRSDLKSLYKRQDEIITGLNEIKVSLQNKADK